MAAINAHLSTVELEGRYETAGDPIAKSHFHALWLLSSGYDIDEVAEVLSFSTRWVRILIKRYNEGGPDRLGDQRVNNGVVPEARLRRDSDHSDGCSARRSEGANRDSAR